VPATLREVVLARTTQLERYRGLNHFDALLHEIEELGRQVSTLLGPNRVWMLNSTETGGGVAEMLPRLCSLLNDVDVDTRWLVLEPASPEFFRTTKQLHNMLHGEPGWADGPRALELYERVCEEASHHLREHVTREDVLVVHDPQPAGIALHVHPEHRPHKLVWRCHIGVPLENEHTQAGWEFLRPYLAPFPRMLFSSEAYVPEEYVARSRVLFPGIDPLSHKNRELRPYKLVGVLRSAGLVEGPSQPPWARFRAQALRWLDGRWQTRPLPTLLHNPMILQVSRFDRLKGFQYLIPAFEHLVATYRERVPHLRADTERVLCEVEHAELVLAGPDPSGIADDPEASAVLDELVAQRARLPESVAARVHLVRLPMASGKENALMVNALQRIAAVLVQHSVQEGFGLTVSEALWKGTPVVASNVGGLGIQIRPGTDGLLVDDPRDIPALAEALLQILAYPRKAELMGAAGKVRVREHFLVLVQVKRWLEEIRDLLHEVHRGAELTQGPPAF